MTRQAIVGEAPPPKAEIPHLPFDGPSGDRMARLLGMTRRDMRASFVLENLFPELPGRWSSGGAREAAGGLLSGRLASSGLVVLCGRRVADAFGRGEDEELRWAEPDEAGRRYAVVPHPSGLSRWWNTEENREAARRFFADLRERATGTRPSTTMHSQLRLA